MRSKVRAFSLIEILAVVAIITCLVAITASVYQQALAKGKTSEEISQMHQIALAANLYHEQNDGWPENTKALVAVGLIPKEVCKSPRDLTANGWANGYLAATSDTAKLSSYRRMIATFPNTYLCFSDIWLHRREEMNRILNEQENGGLFVSLLDSDYLWPSKSPIGPYKGIYRRVLLDGSVVIRQHRIFSGTDQKGKPIKFGSDMTWFFDPSDQWIKDSANSF